MTPTTAKHILRFIYIINGVAAAAAALVLAVAPAAIPAAVGITITPAANLLAYLLAAAELAIASMCGLAAVSSERATDVQTVTVLVIFHIASAVAGMMTVSAGESALILWNVLARAVIVVVLLVIAKAALR
jgi:hypothetical protein